MGIPGLRRELSVFDSLEDYIDGRALSNSMDAGDAVPTMTCRESDELVKVHKSY